MNAGTLEANAGASYEWYMNGNYIAGSNTQFYTPTADGIYTVVVYYANGCSSVSADYTFVQTGISSISPEEVFSVYPNPAIGNLNIVADRQSENETIKMYDIEGRNVISQLIQGGSNTIDVSSLSEGVYYVSLHNVVKKVFVKK
jgi:hypothetical protein